MFTDARRARGIRINKLLPSLFGIMVVSVTLAIHSETWAGLEFCNRSNSKIFLAIAYGQKDAPGTSTNQHRGVTAEGWWDIEPNQCEHVSDIDAGNHWVYYYGHSKSGAYGGNSMLCVSTKRFTRGQQFQRAGDRCPSGYRLEGFRRLDTSKKNFKMTLN